MAKSKEWQNTDMFRLVNLIWELETDLKGEPMGRYWSRRDALYQAMEITGKNYSSGRDGVKDAMFDLRLVLDGRKPL